MNEHYTRCFFEGEHHDAMLQFLNTKHSKQQYFILCDEQTHYHCLSQLLQEFSFLNPDHVIVVPSGEVHKTIDTATGIWRELLLKNAEKNAVLINLGGGVVTDLGGFTASLFKRGIDFIHVPTTLLAMVDAAIGGKNGVNIDFYKNQSGTITFPQFVYINPVYLKTLPDDELINGYAEMIKHGLIADKNYFFELLTHRHFKERSAIAKAIAIKNNIVMHDPFEINQRRLLNFGHTMAHAIESFFQASGVNYPHGKAVAAGMIMESYLSYRMNLINESELNIIEHFIRSLFSFNENRINFDDIFPYMIADKKKINGDIKFTLLETIGKGIINVTVPLDLVRQAVLYFNNHNRVHAV